MNLSEICFMYLYQIALKEKLTNLNCVILNCHTLPSKVSENGM